MSKVRFAAVASVVAAICCFTPLAYAQATRTWVSGVGDDANPCSRTAPCKTFAGAISKTAENGEINVLDPGGFGAVTITKSITIDGSGGSIAGVLAAATTGITVNALNGSGTDPFPVIILRHLDINGAESGLNGIKVLAATEVRIEDCKIFGFQGVVPNGRGILDTRTSGRLFISNTVVSNNGQTGIVIVPASASTLNIFMDNVRMDGHGNAGIALTQGTRAVIARSSASGNNIGFFADTNAALNLTDCVASGNGTGVTSQTGATVRLSNTTVTANGVGLSVSGGSILSYGTNRIDGNTAGNGPPTGGVAQQ